MGLKKFLIYFLLFNVLLASIPFFIQNQRAPYQILIPHFWLLFAVFGILTLSIYLTVHAFQIIHAKTSGQVLLASVVARLFFCMVLVFIYLSKIEVDPTLFLFNFFYIYFFHMAFEIYCLLRNLRNQISK